MAQIEEKLSDAAYRFAEEIRNGRWSHLPDLRLVPMSACGAVTDELRRRCPGFSLEEYQQALADEKRLADAAYRLAEEIRDGRRSHVSDLMWKPATACVELTDELSRRCPGFPLEAYKRALANGMRNSR